MTVEITGIITDIFDTVQASEKFRRREFIVEISEEYNGQSYKQHLKIQAGQAKCEVLSNFAIGQTVKVHVNLNGKRYEKDGKVMYFNSLDMWKIEAVGQAPAQQQSSGQWSKPQQPPAQPGYTPAATSGFYNPKPLPEDDGLPF